MRVSAVFLVFAFALSVGAEVLTSGGCSNAVLIPGPYNGQVVFGNTDGAPSYDNTCGLNTQSGSYFFVITPEANAPMNISTCHSDTNFDTVLAVYQGSDCSSLDCIDYNDDTTCSSISGASSVQFTPNGGSYWVMVAGYNSNEGQFEVSFKQGEATAAGCDDAVTIHGPFNPPVVLFDSLSGNSTTSSQPCNMYSQVLGNWYIIYPTPQNRVTVTTCSDYFGLDTEIAVLTGSNCQDQDCVGYSDDSCGSYSALSTVVFDADEAFYYIYVTGYGSSTGSYYLTISEQGSPSPTASPTPSQTRSVMASSAPGSSTYPSPIQSSLPSASPSPSTSPSYRGSPGSNCGNAIQIPGPGTYSGFSNFGGNALRGTFCGSNVDECNASWFVVAPPAATTVTFSTCDPSTDFDTVLLAFSSCNPSACEDYNDDVSCSYDGLASSLSVFSTGQPIFFAVYGYNCALGDFGVTVNYN